MHNTDKIYRLVISEDCKLPARLRLMVCALAQMADWKTGRGIAGQKRIAEAMGCDVRSVRRYKQRLAAAIDSPVTITWQHRSRPDGLNGSDAYTIRPSDSGQAVLDSGQLGQRHRTASPTNITSGSPQVTPQDKEEHKNKQALGRSDPASNLALTAESLRVNGFHVKAAAKVGEPVEELQAEWVTMHIGRQTLFASQQHLQASFGGWLKRQALAVAAPPEDEWQEVVIDG